MVYPEFNEVIAFGRHVELSLYHITARNPDATLLLRHNHKFWTDRDISRNLTELIVVNVKTSTIFCISVVFICTFIRNYILA